MMSYPAFVLNKGFLFVVLSLGDLLLTWWLLTQSQGQVYESNPIANWWLANAGWVGLAGFKAGVIFLVLLLVAIIARHRPRTGRFVLHFACVVLGCVVCYSGLLAYHSTTGERDAHQVSKEYLQELNQSTRVAFESCNEYWLLRKQLSEGMIQGHYTLHQAVQLLSESSRLRDTTWLYALEGNANRSLQECLAIQLMNEIRSVRRHTNKTEKSEKAIRNLAIEFETAYQYPPHISFASELR